MNSKMADSSNFSILSEVLQKFDLTLEVANHAPSGVNRNWIVRVCEGEKSYVIREHDEYSVFPWEKIVLFNEQAIPFGTTPFLRSEGSPLVVVDGRRFLVRPYIVGTVTDRMTTRQACKVGEMLKRLSSHSWANPKEYDLSVMLTVKDTSPKMPLEMQQNAEAATEILERFAKFPHSIIHGDLTASNIIFNNHDEPIPFDWEGAGYAPAVFDLAAALIGGCWHGGRLDIPLSSAMIAGYGEVDHDVLQDALLVARSKHSMSWWWRQNILYAEYLLNSPSPA